MEILSFTRNLEPRKQKIELTAMEGVFLFVGIIYCVCKANE